MYYRCELLSESYLCIIVHNTIFVSTTIQAVVNCFQNRIFALSFTTMFQSASKSCRL